jgi:hypothetical protein
VEETRWYRCDEPSSTLDSVRVPDEKLPFLEDKVDNPRFHMAPAIGPTPGRIIHYFSCLWIKDFSYFTTRVPPSPPIVLVLNPNFPFTVPQEIK